MSGRMSDSQGYELRETVSGVTFLYGGQGLDPSFLPDPTIIKDQTGDYEEFLLFVNNDNPVMAIFEANPLSPSIVSIFTYKTKKKWWRYTINTTKQTWTRINAAGVPSPERPVSDLLIMLDDGADNPHQVTKITVTGSGGSTVTIEYPGSTCRVVYNPATRQYQLVCTNP